MLSVVGGVVEVLGLAVAVVGVAIGWRRASDGQYRFFTGKPKNPPRVRISSVGLESEPAVAPREPVADVDGHLARLDAEVDDLREQLSAERVERREHERVIQSRVDALAAQTVSEASTNARGDLRLTALGLALASLGAILQTVGAALPPV